jgi:predicted  nucleic acid-binding Zn-ribbon protein
MTCPNCLKALQLVVHEEFTDRCVPCGIRRMAYMDGDERQRMLDAIQHVHGPDTRAEATRMVREECARIRALREAQSV